MGFRNVFTLLGCLLCFGLGAQYKLEVQVTQIRGAVEKGVYVDLVGYEVCETDSTGICVFENLSPSSYELYAHKGERSVSENLDINQDTLITLVLKKVEYKAENLDTLGRSYSVFNVYGSQDQVKQMRDIDGTAIYAAKKTELIQLDKTMGNKSTGNPREVYAGVSGLNVYEGSRGGLQLNIGGRGLDPNRTANFNTRQNGYDISADVLGYPESYYTPPVQALDEIQIVRGAAALQYGTQFGGLINFKLKEADKKPIAWESIQGFGSFDLFTSFNRLSGTLDKVEYQVYYNLKTGNNFRPNSAFESHNLFGQLAWQLNRKTRLTFESTFMNYLEQQPGGLTDDQFNRNPNYSNRTRNWFKINWQLYALRLDHAFNRKNRLSLQLFGLDASRYALGFRGNPFNSIDNITTAVDEQDADGFIYPRDLIKGDYFNWGAELRYLKEFDFMGEKSALLIGGKYYQSDNLSEQGPGSRAAEADFDFSREFDNYPNQSRIENPNLNFSGFSEMIIPIGSKIKITPGVRYEYINTGSEGEALRINFDGAGNEINRNLIKEDRERERAFFLFGLGLSVKPSRKTELYANLSENYRSITFSDIQTINGNLLYDPNIQDASGYTADIGLRGKFLKALQYDLTAYRIFYDNRIGIRLDGSGMFQTTNIGEAVINGLESFISLDVINALKISNKKWISNVFLNLAYTQSVYKNVRDGVNNVEGNSVEFVPEWNIKSGLRLGYGRFKTSLQMTYLSKQFTDATNAEEPSEDGTRGAIPGYIVWDWSFRYGLKKVYLEGGINNMLGASYFTQRASGYPGPGIIPSEPQNFYVSLGWNL